MINYTQLGEYLTDVFGIEITFENNKDSFLITRHMAIAPEKYFISGAPIYSSEFTFKENQCEFILWFEVKANRKTAYEKSTAQMNDLFSKFRIGETKFKLYESIGKLWVGITFSLTIPNPSWELGDTFDYESAVRCLIHFRMTVAGFTPLWFVGVQSYVLEKT